MVNGAFPFDKGLIELRKTTFADVAANTQDLVDAPPNIMLALLEYSMGNESEARRIRREIKKRFEFDEGVVICGTNLPRVTFGLLEHALGNKSNAILARNHIRRKCGHRRILIGDIVNGRPHTDENACLALLEYSLGNDQKAIKIRDRIVKDMGYDGDLIRTRAPFIYDERGKKVPSKTYAPYLYYGVKRVPCLSSRNIGTFPNACFGLLEFALGEKEKAMSIRDAILERIGFLYQKVHADRNGKNVKPRCLINEEIESGRNFRSNTGYVADNVTFALLDYVLQDKRRLRRIVKRRIC